LCNGDNSSVKVDNFVQGLNGITFNLLYENKKYKIFAPLYGEQHAINIMLSFAAAVNLGIPIDTIIMAIKSIPQIKHRLELKKIDNDIIVIDDAFNSNPIGFKAALKLLKDLKNIKKYGRTILVTPGMVELGEKHALEHEEIGKVAAQDVDVLLAVIPDRMTEFIHSFNQHKHINSLVILCENFKSAKEWLDMNMQSGDIILFENDLPDIYETKLTL
jgi:UDP-N-acetylmuramoyl-tripeptide--D-alanyl-D-alanine ligase